MRLLALACIVLPQAVWAQLFGGGFAAGSYVLRDSRYVRMPGQLKLQSGSRLVVKYADGETVKLTPDQVASFRIGSQRYVTAGGFHVIGGLGGADVDLAFVEQLDSGQIVLMRYAYNIGAPGPLMNATGGMSAGGSTAMSTYLLSSGTISGVVAAQAGAYSSGGKRFREAVRPYFNGRPDLQKQVDDKRITAENLPEAVRAFNTNSPYFAPR